MTESLKIRTSRTGEERAARPVASPMTCDVPVVLGRPAPPVPTDSSGCLTSGRSPRTHRRAAGIGAIAPISVGRKSGGDRSFDVSATRSNAGHSNTPRSNSPRSETRLTRRRAERRTVAPEVGRRRRWAAGLLLGAGCAILVAVLGVAGEDYSAAATGAPAATQVVHVRSGESLVALAARIAPEQPAAAVIATVRELNDLQTAGLRPGQALLVPAYR